ncbi:putative membrane bound O-acyl transferase family protein [Lyophyllum shimeji]|uniref:Membrane bound O-acyl transferase family protein n=1 Tax=Lyophyllum shimeji TaxID=47721 RepID=A0A9P3UKK3_LYOSH|nr:putative membrane bound O-acyl transferase family protein [Lyophyllum shimeji]
MTWLDDVVPLPTARQELTRPAFLRHILPAILCYYATSVLVLVPNTFWVRLAILPLSLWICFDAATRLDVAKTYDDERLLYLNQGLVGTLTLLGVRMIRWSLHQKPPWRAKALRETTPEFYATSPPPMRGTELAASACDLCFNLRGCGWNWGRQVHIPRENRSDTSTTAFVIPTLLSFLFHLAMVDILHHAILYFAPTAVASASGGSIFDADLPPILRYSKSTLLVFLSGLFTYSFLQAGHDLSTLCGILVFRQDPSLWPPAFEAPWLSTSLTEFWARRWHQFFRDIFASVGGEPMLLLGLGRPGALLGAFFVSAVVHNFGMWGIGRGAEFMRVGGFFVINGVGVVLEHIWRAITGYRVGGWFGRLWVYVWIVGWAHLLVEAWATKGLFGSKFLPRYLRPTTYIFDASS